jgi:hypothetical protein
MSGIHGTHLDFVNAEFPNGFDPGVYDVKNRVKLPNDGVHPALASIFGMAATTHAVVRYEHPSTGGIEVVPHSSHGIVEFNTEQK